MKHTTAHDVAAGGPAEPLPDGPKGFCWRIAGDALPRLGATLRIGEAARAAIYRGAHRRGLLLPDYFHRSHDEQHGHAFWLPVDLDGDGALDHVMVYAADGLPEGLLPVLAEGAEVRLYGLDRWRLAPIWMGMRAPGPLFGPARRWTSSTPYITPLWRAARRRAQTSRARYEPAQQLQAEIAQRRLPADLVRLRLQTHVMTASRLHVPVQEFVRATRNRKPPGDAVAIGAELTFSEPVWGPLAFGFGAHFGLGLFAPVEDDRPRA